MGGRPTNIKISKTKFEAALKLRGYSKAQLIRELNSITYRTLDRNLSDGTMSYSTLNDICKILDVLPSSICDEEQHGWEDYQPLLLPRDISTQFDTFGDWVESRTDSSAGFFPTYRQYKKHQLSWSDLFIEYASEYCTVKNGKTSLTLDNETIQKIAPHLENDIREFMATYLSKRYKEYYNGKHKEKR